MESDNLSLQIFKYEDLRDGRRGYERIACFNRKCLLLLNIHKLSCKEKKEQSSSLKNLKIINYVALLLSVSFVIRSVIRGVIPLQ